MIALRICPLFCCILAVPLLGLHDQERQEAFCALVSKKEAMIPPETRAWLDEQVIRLDQFDAYVSRLDKKKILKKLHKAEKSFQEAPQDPPKRFGNKVLTPEQVYIVSECPSETAEDAFWNSVIEAGVGTIVSLVTPHREAYWNDSRFPKTVGKYTITKVSEEAAGTSPFFSQHKIVWRTFEISKHNGAWTTTVNHFHYENWPDHDAPEDTLFRQLLHLVEEHHPDGSVPLLVHCAAGIGRSGTFVAAHSLRKEVRLLRRKDGPHLVNIPKRVLQLRMQRRKMLSHPTQLGAVIEAVRDSVFEHYLTQKKSYQKK